MTDSIQEIRDRIDLVELVSRHVALRRAGNSFKGLCPFHQEKTPSFTVNPQGGFFKCFGCGVGGDCFSFVMQMENLTFVEAAERLARQAGVEFQRRGDTRERRSERERLLELNALAERFYRRQLDNFRPARDYLLNRGLTEETLEEFKLGYAPATWEALLHHLRKEGASIAELERAGLTMQGQRGPRDRFVDRIMFPIHDVEGRPIGFGARGMKPDAVPKYLNSPDTPTFNKSRTLYGLNLARKAIDEAGFAVTVEGYMDVIGCHQAGVTNVIATLGTALTEDHARILRRYTDNLVMAYDGDSAGLKAALRNSGMFEEAGCNVRVLAMPSGQDPDSLIQEEGVGAFHHLVNQALPLLDFRLEQLRQEHDLQSAEGRLAYVRAAAAAIADSQSHLTRQEYAGRVSSLLDRLAEEWYPGEPRRAEAASRALRQELDQLLGSRKPPSRRRQPEARPKTAARSQTAAVDSAIVDRTALAEQYVLRAALSDPRWMQLLTERLETQHFSGADFAAVAAALLTADGDEPSARRERVLQQHELAEAVSTLLMSEGPQPTDEGVEDGVRQLERSWKQQRLRQIQAEISKGTGSQTDQLKAEYRRLEQEVLLVDRN